MKTNQNQLENTQENRTQPNSLNAVQGFIANPQVFLSRDGESLIHRLPGNMKIELHTNLYRKILGGEFTPKEKRIPAGPSVSRPRIYGFFAQPEIFLSRDGQYLIHRVLGVRVSKAANYYRSILKIEFTPKAAMVATQETTAELQGL